MTEGPGSERPEAASLEASTLAELTFDGEPSAIVLVLEQVGGSVSPSVLDRIVVLAGHPDLQVRKAVASVLPTAPGPHWVDESHTVAATLMTLMTDDEPHVRNWATFGLGTQLRVDGAEIRASLIERLDDTHDETRLEAILGLARRKDKELLVRLQHERAAGAVDDDLLVGATHFACPSLAEALGRLADRWTGDRVLLTDAQNACDPAGVEMHAELIERLLLAGESVGVHLTAISELLEEDEPLVHVSADPDQIYDLIALVETRAGGSIEEAIRLVRSDMHSRGTPIELGS